MIPYAPTQNNTFSYGYNYNIVYTVTGNRFEVQKRCLVVIIYRRIVWY